MTRQNILIAYTQLIVAVDFAVGPSYEVVIVGDSQGNDTKEMLAAIRGRFIPNKIVVLRPTEEESPEIDKIASFAKYYSTRDGKATAYICLDHNCRLPTTDITTMLGLLSSEQLQ